MSKEVAPVRLPGALKENTVASLPVGAAFYDTADVVYRQYLTDLLFLDRNEPINDKRPTKLLGRVGIMHDFVVEGEELLPGYVVDLRFAKPTGFAWAHNAEMPDDQEEANEWLEEKKSMIPIAAVAYHNPDTKETQVAGDERFAASALRLAELSDKLEKKIKKAEAKAKKAEKVAKSKPANKSTKK